MIAGGVRMIGGVCEDGWRCGGCWVEMCEDDGWRCARMMGGGVRMMGRICEDDGWRCVRMMDKSVRMRCGWRCAMGG